MAGRQYTDDEMIASVREAARDIDGPLTVAAYDAWRTQHGGASGIGIIRRFGKWHVVCEKAGLAEVVKTTKKPGISREAIVDAVALYFDEPDCRGSYNGYKEWAAGREGVPSGATVRNNFPRWAELLELVKAR